MYDGLSSYNTEIMSDNPIDWQCICADIRRGDTSCLQTMHRDQIQHLIYELAHADAIDDIRTLIQATRGTDTDVRKIIMNDYYLAHKRELRALLRETQDAALTHDVRSIIQALTEKLAETHHLLQELQAKLDTE